MSSLVHYGPCTYPFIHLFVDFSSIHLSTHLSIHFPSTNRSSIHSSFIHPSHPCIIYPSIYLSMHPSMHASINLPFDPLTDLSTIYASRTQFKTNAEYMENKFLLEREKLKKAYEGTALIDAACTTFPLT